ncbi:hypothetical protein RQ734_22290 [Roseomonas mucosa]|uniref:hypothetical protein n=1 Tax=Roseomonas mucosa TaxID=207340 RepID=UPI0028CD7D3B|nr:hypothetical protein [Roseomonas mucosa]MDT8278789.1 hypothetical protein [Roseomonas mucosa]
MPKLEKARNLLVIRPWIASYSSSETFGHFDGLVMRQRETATPRHYCDLEVLHAGDDDRKVLLHEGFRFQCQIDERQPEPYGWRWGYSPAHSSMFTAQDLGRFGKSITAMDRALTRMREVGGPPETIGHYVVRLAHILHADGIVILETSLTGSFEGHLAIKSWAMAPLYGDMMGTIEALARDLQAACAARLARRAA